MKKSFLKNKRASSQALTVFFRQFATLVNAGIPLVQVCSLLEKSQKSFFYELMTFIKKEILAGRTLAYCLQQFPQYFNHFICQLVHIGEQTGKLERILSTIAEHQEKELLFKKQLRQALFYPCIILSTALIITFLMFLFVIPKFAILFADMQSQLPLLTTIIFHLAEILQRFIWVLVLFVMLFFILSFYAKKKIVFIAYLMKLPLLRLHFNKIILVHFARNLALTFNSGMALTEALNISAKVTGNIEFIRIINEVCTKIRSGLPLYYGMNLFPIFPALMVQMIKIGEESGQLNFMLNKTADFFEADVQQSIKYFTQLLEPLIMLVLGVLIGGLILGMYLPIFKLGSVF